MAVGSVYIYEGLIKKTNKKGGVYMNEKEFWAFLNAKWKGCDKIPKSIIADMGKLLLENNVSFQTKETIMMTLAHHVSDEALSALKEYNKNPDKELRIFAELALDECEMWNED